MWSLQKIFADIIVETMTTGVFRKTKKTSQKMKFSKTVVYLGLTSLFCDVATESIYSLLPIFLHKP